MVLDLEKIYFHLEESSVNYDFRKHLLNVSLHLPKKDTLVSRWSVVLSFFEDLK